MQESAEEICADVSVEETTEAHWIRLWRDGDRQAGDRVLGRYAPILRSYFHHRVAGNSDELIQRTLVACVQGVQRFEGRSSFSSYLLGIARNQYLMSLRGDKRQSNSPDLLTSNPEDSPSQRVAFRQEQSVLLAALIRVPACYRRALKMYYWEGLSITEIGFQLQIAQGTVKSRLARGRSLVKVQLERMQIPSQVRDELIRELIVVKSAGS